MSGGHFQLLCYKDAQSILEDSSLREEIGFMAEYLKDYDNSYKAVRLTLDLASRFEEAKMQIDAIMEGLNVDLAVMSDVWRAVEWYESMDISKAQAQQVINQFDKEALEEVDDEV